jgi:hypothetical protein
MPATQPASLASDGNAVPGPAGAAVSASDGPNPVLTAAQWRARSLAHEQRIDAMLGPVLARRRAHGRHSIEEFLFTYYSFRPAQLRRWHPGQGVALEDATVAEFGPLYRCDAAGRLVVDTRAILAKRAASIEWIHRLLVATAGRPAHLGCFGMHEWAMVYRQTEAQTRHNIFPLRLGAEATAELVDELTIRCSHFDAFRFFTPAARPLNILQPSRDTQAEYDQPGCLHANMDVYRWAYKLSPLAPSELVADCFEAAREIRTLDMRASPYDLTALGLDPIRVETPQGRAEYVRQQGAHSHRTAALRHRLIETCQAALAAGAL